MKKRKAVKAMTEEEKKPAVTEEAPVQEETPAQDAAENATEQDAAALTRQLEEAATKADEYLSMAQRVQADFDNFRRRNESARADAYSEGQRNVAAAMLPVLDNLERAVAAADTAEGDALKSGVELTLRLMRDALTKLEVTPIDRQGEAFDPHLENAVLQGTADDGEPGTVCQVLQKGYMMGKTVLRHAMVKVVPED